MWPDGVHLNGAIVAQPVEKIASMAGIVYRAKNLMAEGKEVESEESILQGKTFPGFDRLEIWSI